MPAMTLEQAQERILELTEQLNDLSVERDTLRTDKEALEAACHSLREMNQRYFNKLIAQESKPEPEQEEEQIPTCEEFAATLNI